MAGKTTKTKPMAPPPAVRPQEDKPAYEMWRTREDEQGPVEHRGAAECLLLEELQRRGPRKRSDDKIPRTKDSK